MRTEPAGCRRAGAILSADGYERHPSDRSEYPPRWHPDSARTADYSGRSNLALAFLCLPPDKRADMNVFYTFCRLVDDIADSPIAAAGRENGLLDAWREVVLLGPEGTWRADAAVRIGPLTTTCTRSIAKYRLPPEHFLEIIAGVEMDIVSRQYASFEQLRAYCYRVASVVGLVSIEIFGYRDERHPAVRGRSRPGAPDYQHHPRRRRRSGQRRPHLPAARRSGTLRLHAGGPARAGL